MTESRSFRRWRGVLAAALAVLAIAPLAPLRAADQCEWKDVDRIVAVGDVHGAYDRYVEILRVAGIIDAKDRWAGGTTHFVQVGDIVDRGDDSRKALDLLRRLEREARSARGFVHVLLGNHEAARMLGDMRYVTAGEYAAFTNSNSSATRERFLKLVPEGAERDEAMKQTPLGFVEMRIAFGHNGDYGRWLRQLPVTITINGFVFVHGGISPPVAAMGCEAINDQVKRDLTDDLEKTRATPLASLTARVDGPLWYRGLALEPDTFAPQVAEIVAALRARAVVVAHTVTTTGRIATRFDGRVIQIDTGMQPAYVPTGRASALEIQRGASAATAIYVDRRDPVPLPKP
jgi:hypothetical protein